MRSEKSKWKQMEDKGEGEGMELISSHMKSGCKEKRAMEVQLEGNMRWKKCKRQSCLNGNGKTPEDRERLSIQNTEGRIHSTRPLCGWKIMSSRTPPEGYALWHNRRKVEKKELVCRCGDRTSSSCRQFCKAIHDPRVVDMSIMCLLSGGSD